MKQSIEEIVRGIVKEEVATALKSKVTFQIQYNEDQEEKTEDTTNEDVSENNLNVDNQAIQ